MSSDGKRLPVSAGWKDRALGAEAEVERLRAKLGGLERTAANEITATTKRAESAEAEVERLREAMWWRRGDRG